MRFLLFILFATLLSMPVFAGKKHQCRKGYEKISCEKVEKAKRSAFCWKGEISDKKKNKICKTKKRKVTKKKKIKK